jgi:peptide/nickel transport system permease protein
MMATSPATPLDVGELVVATRLADRGVIRFARRHPLVTFELIVLALVLTASFCASLLPLDNPNVGDLVDSLLPPGSAGHLLGTDQQGRDLLARSLYAIRTSMLIAIGATLGAMALGMLVGLTAGAVRRLDALLMRVVDVQMSFPALVLAVAVVAALGGASTVNVLVVLIVTGWVAYARVCRAMVLRMREAPFVDAARATGATGWRIARRHFVPNVIPTLLGMAVADFAMVMIQEASLSYLGLGVPASTPTLGVMMHEGQSVLFTAWWPAVVPAVVMAVLVLMLTSIGDFASRMLNRT